MIQSTEKWDIEAPIDRWDEAIALGNGLTGVLLWGNSSTVKLSLDRSDLWDERMNAVSEDKDWNRRALEEICTTEDRTRLSRLDKLHAMIPATKLPVGRLEIEFAEPLNLDIFSLDFTTAVGCALTLQRESLLECFCAADGSGIYLHLAEPEKATLRIIPPDYSCTGMENSNSFEQNAAFLGYEQGMEYSDGNLSFYVQPCLKGLHYGIFVIRLTADKWLLRILRTDSQQEMERLVQRYRNQTENLPDYEKTLESHTRWWQTFWTRAQVKLPDPILTRYYNFCRYLYGSSSRLGAPPAALQGVWTADNNMLPPWKGDYHHDLNTQMTYIAYLTSGDFECGLSFLNHLSEQIETYRAFARNFFGVGGIAVPGTATLAGQALGGWVQYSMSPTNSAWLATMFANHYRYTLDQRFLIEQALPFVIGVGEFILNLLREDAKGIYYLPLSSSPEIHDAELEAFLPSMSNYDLALLMRLFEDLEYLNQAAGNQAEASIWSSHRHKLPDFAVDPEAGLMLCADELLRESHRHHSHLMAIYPLRLLKMERDTKLIENSFRHLDSLGTGWWVGYSFVWAGAMGAYCGNGGRALRMLRIFMDGFISRNGFHLNGDYKNYGYSWFKYRPFTLEANFLSMQLIHEMLLQSHGNEFKIFPALPAEWTEIEFKNLYGESSVKVSAALRKNKVRYVSLTARYDCKIILHYPGRKSEVFYQDGERQEWPNAKKILTLKAGKPFILIASE